MKKNQCYCIYIKDIIAIIISYRSLANCFAFTPSLLSLFFPEGVLVGVILRFGVHVPQSMSDVILGCAVNASPATLLVNVSGRFYEYALKGEVSRGNGHQVQDDEMLRKARGWTDGGESCILFCVCASLVWKYQLAGAKWMKICLILE